MIGKYLRLFGLTEDATLNDVKKTYRKLAKRNHPDLFQGKEIKSEQDKVMTRLNEAYRFLVDHFSENNKTAIKTDKPVRGKAGNDTILYKKGVEFFGRYQGSISLKFPQYTRFDKESILEKENNLKEARKHFERLLNEYPESDWAFDSEERIRKIDRILKDLEKNPGEEKETLPRDDANFYYNKFNKLFKNK